MSEEKLYENLMSLSKGIDVCLDNRLVGPALILIYSAIDTVGWLDSDQPFATRKSFVAWTERYLLATKQLKCTAIDLYAARCGLLHTFTPNSKLSSDQATRRICYAHGNARVEDLQRTIDLANSGNEYVAVKVEELFAAWQDGLLVFVNELETDDERSERVLTKARNFFSEMGTKSVKELLDAVDQQENGE